MTRIDERCWCWQTGRCLADCPTADVPRPRPLTVANWRRAWTALWWPEETDR